MTSGPSLAGCSALIAGCAYGDSHVMDEITILQAEVLKTLASPRRIEILHALARGPMEVGRLADALGAAQPNVSQHLAVLRGAGLVEAERDGREVRYRLADPDVVVACAVMRGVLERRLARLGQMASGAVGVFSPAATAASQTQKSPNTTQAAPR
jgi:DNA-binding transcriptional ArsR family regulator